MDVILRGYHVDEPTWFYLSLLLIIAVFVKFNRLWSVRNLDLGLMLLIAPGLLIVQHQPAFGYVWLFVTTGLLLIRVLGDGVLIRRPRLEQNMNAAGLTFLGAAAFLFLMTKVMTESPAPSTVASVRRAHQMLQLSPEAAPAVQDPASGDGDAPQPLTGPASSLLAAPVVGISRAVADRELPSTASISEFELIAARTMAILAHLAVVTGLMFVGYRIFGDLELGVAMATLYLLLPGTAFEVEKVHHVLPAALILWAISAYRKPLVSGTLLGLACGTMFFPIFLLPLWLAFYGRRGAIRFGVALSLITAVMLGTLLLTAADEHTFTRTTFGYIQWSDLQFRVTTPTTGFWQDHESAYRIPVFVTFLVMLVALTFWPGRKSLSHLISHSAAIVIGIQFWYPQQGGVYVLWYLPLLLLVVFRPALVNHLPPDLKPYDWLLMFQKQNASGAERQKTELAASVDFGRRLSYR